MKLYLKIDIPEGKRVRFCDELTGKVDYKHTYVLFPKKAVEIEDGIGEKLMKQNPHLIGDKPYSPPKREKKGSEDIPPKGEKKLDEGYFKVLDELAGLMLGDLKSSDIMSYGEKLGIEIPQYITRSEKIEMLEKRCAELAEALPE